MLKAIFSILVLVAGFAIGSSAGAQGTTHNKCVCRTILIPDTDPQKCSRECYCPGFGPTSPVCQQLDATDCSRSFNNVKCIISDGPVKCYWGNQLVCEDDNVGP